LTSHRDHRFEIVCRLTAPAHIRLDPAGALTWAAYEVARASGRQDGRPSGGHDGDADDKRNRISLGVTP
jgi:hypothetical protein